MRLFILILLSFVVLNGCSSSKKMTTDSTKLDDLVAGKNYTITSEWAQPQVTNALMSLQNVGLPPSGLFPLGSNPGMINLQGNSNYIKIKGDSISADLPYYGEQLLGGSYNQRDIGIQFKGIPKKKTIEKNKKNVYKIGFQIDEKTHIVETYNVIIRIFPSLKTTVNINSSHRRFIQYTGFVEQSK